MTNYEYIHSHTGVSINRIQSAIDLLDQGATIPFIARYRKDQTQSLTAPELRTIQGLAEEYEAIENRKSGILSKLEEQDNLTDELEETIRNTYDKTKLEDLYLPFKKRRKTLADKAIEAGLEPLADLIMAQETKNIEAEAEQYLNKEDGIDTVSDAIEGAQNIIMQRLNHDQELREHLRKLYDKHGRLTAKVKPSKKEEAEKYSDYFDYSEHWKKAPSHRVMAVLRAGEEGLLTVHLLPDDDKTISQLQYRVIDKNNPNTSILGEAVKEAYKKYLSPSIENEFMNAVQHRAETEAAKVFADNLESLLMSPLLGNKAVIALDPGIKTGCKTVVLDSQGEFIEKDVLYFHDEEKKEENIERLNTLADSHDVSDIAIGNGTGGRDVFSILEKEFDDNLSLYIVDESGASVYSASEEAEEEFPDLDLTFRGAISIGRRLQDPLAELIKINPKAMGIGQYHHDISDSILDEKLNNTISDCIHAVGINLNTASKKLLRNVSGVGDVLAENILDHKSSIEKFKSRDQLLNVDRMGDKTYQQCVGFLRIPEGENFLDNTSIHPEHYDILDSYTSSRGVEYERLKTALQKEGTIRKDLSIFLSERDLGEETIKDIIKQLQAPGRSTRVDKDPAHFNQSVTDFSDLKVDMKLNGKVTNITDFGAFVDIGIKDNGLVHISEMSEDYVKHPSHVVSLQEDVNVKIIGLDADRKRIQLSMKE